MFFFLHATVAAMQHKPAGRPFEAQIYERPDVNSIKVSLFTCLFQFICVNSVQIFFMKQLISLISGLMKNEVIQMKSLNVCVKAWG